MPLIIEVYYFALQVLKKFICIKFSEKKKHSASVSLHFSKGEKAMKFSDEAGHEHVKSMVIYSIFKMGHGASCSHAYVTDPCSHA